MEGANRGPAHRSLIQRTGLGSNGAWLLGHAKGISSSPAQDPEWRITAYPSGKFSPVALLGNGKQAKICNRWVGARPSALSTHHLLGFCSWGCSLPSCPWTISAETGFTTATAVATTEFHRATCPGLRIRRIIASVPHCSDRRAPDLESDPNWTCLRTDTTDNFPGSTP